jgi:hypothetical protein
MKKITSEWFNIKISTTILAFFVYGRSSLKNVLLRKKRVSKKAPLLQSAFSLGYFHRRETLFLIIFFKNPAAIAQKIFRYHGLLQ